MGRLALAVNGTRKRGTVYPNAQFPMPNLKYKQSKTLPSRYNSI